MSKHEFDHITEVKSLCFSLQMYTNFQITMFQEHGYLEIVLHVLRSIEELMRVCWHVTALCTLIGQLYLPIGYL